MSGQTATTRMGICFFVVLLLNLPAAVRAQSSGDAHPWLSNDFQLKLGAFFPQKDFEFRASGTIPGDDIDFDKTLGVGDSETTPALSFRWNFGEKWSLWGQAWKVNSSGRRVLKEDVEWDDIVFREGSNVRAGVENSVGRVFFGRKISTGSRHEFGLGAGLHWMEIKAFIEGEVFVDDETTEFQRGSVDTAIPLPNIGAWYYYSPSPRWLLQARIDWLSASIGNYSGSLWDTSFGANYQLTDHFGLGLDYVFFKLDLDIEKEDWNGKAELSQSGPFLSLTANW